MSEINDVFYAGDIADCYILNKILKVVFPKATISIGAEEDGKQRIYLSCKMDEDEYFKVLKDRLLEPISLEARMRGNNG